MKWLAPVCTAVAAAVAAAVPWPEGAVERWYSTGIYPWLQRPMTWLSNRVPFAVIDVVLVTVLVAWAWLAVADVRSAPRGRLVAAAGRIGARTIFSASALYLVFLALWGFNYRRVPLERKLVFDARSVTTEAARSAALVAVSRVNAMHDDAHKKGWPPDGAVDARLGAAFSAVTRELGNGWQTVLSRPKHTLLNLYFRPAAVDGMTDPLFLETLISSDLLPFERPFIVAHEWSHLAGFADEAEANFAGWLTCTRADPPSQYSGWLFLYSQLAGDLPRRDREDVTRRLAAGPRDDLRAVAERLSRNVRPQVSAAGWRVYDKYLKANRVEAGAASYGQVVRLVLGTDVGRLASSN